MTQPSADIAAGLSASHLSARFLFRFHYRGSAPEPSREIVPGIDWAPTVVPATYTDERLRSFASNQFGSHELRQPAPGYLTVSLDRFDAFKSAKPIRFTVLPRSISAAPFAMIEIDRLAELFLPPGYGTGLFSIRITPRENGEPIQWDFARDLIYGLSQRLAVQKGVLLTTGMPSRVPGTDSKAWAEGLRTAYANGREFESPLLERIARGGAFSLEELVSFLLRPVLKSLHGVPSRGDLQAYSVLRFPKSVVLNMIERPAHIVDPRLDLGGLAASVCQLEESAHPLPPVNDPGVALQMLSTHHLASVSTQGAAHLIFDQGVEFDNSRPGRCLHQYFMDYLAAVQASSSLKALAEDSWLLAQQKEPNIEQIRDLQRKITIFLNRSDLLAVSSRDAHNRYYRLAFESIGISRQLKTLQDSVADFDRGTAANKQIEIAEATHEAHRKLAWIEVFIISVYAFEVAEKLGDLLSFSHGFVASGSTFVLLATLGIAIHSLILTNASEAGSPATKSHGSTPFRKIFGVLGILVSYLLLGFVSFRHGEAPTAWLDLKRAVQGIPTLREDMERIESNYSHGGALESEIGRMRGRLSEATKASDLKDQAVLVCPESCIAANEKSRQSHLGALRAWQRGDFQTAAAVWREIVETAKSDVSVQKPVTASKP